MAARLPDRARQGELDEMLARRAALGDREAFDVVVRRHGLGMYRYASRILSDPGDAQEAVQDAFVAAWKGLDRFRGRSTLRTWLFALTAHKARDIQRRHRPMPAGDERVLDRRARPQDDPETQAMRSGLLRALDQALAELPTRQRACWLLVEVEGMTQAETAQVLRMTPDAVRGQLSRGRRALTKKMEKWR